MRASAHLSGQSFGSFSRHLVSTFPDIRYRPPVLKDKTMELLLLIVLLFVLFGGGFGFYRGGYYRQGGPVGIGGILGLIAVVLVIGWLVHGHIGGVSF